MSIQDIVNIAYNNDLYYSTEFESKGRKVLVFSVYSKSGEKKFKERMKGYVIERVFDSHNENMLIGVMI